MFNVRASIRLRPCKRVEHDVIPDVPTDVRNLTIFVEVSFESVFDDAIVERRSARVVGYIDPTTVFSGRPVMVARR